MNIITNNHKLIKEYKERFVGKRFRHFKGDIYKVIDIGINTEDGCMYAIYQSENDPSLVWVRPVEMFESEVDKVKYPDVEQKMRFECLDD